MSLKPTLAGLYNLPALNVGSLFINGVAFTQFITNIQNEDQLDDAEVAEIQAFLARLDISGLTGNLIIDDSNRNSVLLSAIQTLQTKTSFLDTTALTQSWVITDANRNALLKTSIDNLQTKTNLLDTTALTQAWVITDANRNATLLTTITSQAGDISALQTKTQYISSSSGVININTDTINIGQYNALVPSTQTNLRGDIYTNQAYFKSLNTSSVFNWVDFITLINSTSLPAYVASAAITAVSAFLPSDILRMAGSVIKDGDIQTTNDIKVDEFKMFNTSVVGLDILSKFLVFMAKGNASLTTILGDIAMQTFSGHIFMRNNNISATTIDWIATEQRDKCNIVSIQNNDILIHLGAAQAGGDIEIINSCGGDIVFKNGTNGLKSGTTSVMKIKYNNNFLDQIEMGLIDPNLNWATNNSKLFVVQLYNQTNGITVGSPDVFPATNHKFSHLNSTNVNTGALILQDGYAGTTNKAIYTVENGQKLFYSGQQVYPPLPQNVGGVGITYIIRNPTNATAPQTLTMSEVYVSQVSRSITLSNYNANTEYLMATSIGLIPKDGNPVISGTIQHDQHLTYTANQTGQIYDKVYFRATSSQNVIYDHPTEGNTTYNNVLRFIYPKTNTTEINTSGPVYTAFIPVCNNSATLTLHSITITRVALSNTGNNNSFVRLELVNAIGGVIHQFTDVAYSNGIAQTITFGGSLTTINISNTTAVRFKFTNLGTTNPSIIQTALTGAQGVNGLMYIIHGSPNQVYTTLLYDGTTNKTNLVNNATDDYILTLPITTMDITQLYEPNLQIETYFIQPTGTTSNHQVQFLYNDGYLSHIDSTFSATQSTPNIQQVLTAGNNAGNLDITSLGTISPSAITGWNVKEITAGTNISRTITSGSYAIANTAPVQDAQAGTGISVSKAGGVATISNTAVVQDTQAGSGISVSKASGVATISNTGIITATAGSNISVSVANNNLNITNTANVTDVIAGNGITIGIAGGTATISQSLFQAIGNANDLSTTESTVKGQKAPDYYGKRWRHRTDITNKATNDIIVSATGQYVYVGTTSTSMYYSSDYGHTFFNSGYNDFIESRWISLAMSSTGKRVYMIGTINYGTTTNWRLHISNTFGASWSARAANLGMDDITTALPQNVCCSGDGTKILITDARAGSSGKVYTSGDSGLNFNTFNIASGVALADDCCMSSNGQIQFITTNESTGGLTHAAIYRSSNFGNNWTKAFTKVSGDSDFGQIDCDTTGRIVVCCRKGGGTNNAALLSLDYGVSWVVMSIANARSVSISPNGFRIWFGGIDGRVSYSDNYGETITQYDIGSGLVYDRISTNADGTTVFTNNSTIINQYINTAYSYMERFKIEELATQHYFCYTTNILQPQATGTFTAFPTDMDFINYEYYITFDFDKIYYDKDIYLGFNDQIDIPHQYDALYYASTITNNAESLRVRERNWVIQASDAGKFPIFYSPSAGSFFYCSASITYRFYAVSQKILIMERQGFTHYRAFNASVVDGKGFSNTLADGVGIDYHTIRGRIDFINAKLYLDGNNANWAPNNFKVFYNNATNIGPASVRISNIERKAKNRITY